MAKRFKDQYKWICEENLSVRSFATWYTDSCGTVYCTETEINENTTQDQIARAINVIKEYARKQWHISSLDNISHVLYCLPDESGSYEYVNQLGDLSVFSENAFSKICNVEVVSSETAQEP